jgi:tRNA (cmo5U34)-methyltransferase
MENTGDSITAGNANWTFGGNVCEKFDEHVAKSVPLD